MSQVRFLTDHDLNEHIVVGVQRREPTIEFLRVRDLGLNDKPDAEIVEYADQQGLIVVSHDVTQCLPRRMSALLPGKRLLGF